MRRRYYGALKKTRENEKIIEEKNGNLNDFIRSTYTRKNMNPF